MSTSQSTSKSKSKKRWAIGGGLAGVALAATLTGGVVFADTSGSGSGTPTSGTPTSGTPATTTTVATPRGQDFRQRLATDLGVTTDQLTAAFKQAAGQTVDDAVAAGQLTQAQGDKLKAKIANGQPGDGWRLLRRHRRNARVKGAVGADIAGQLSITTDELKSELASGQSLKDIITAHGQTVDAVVNAVINDAQTKLDARESKLLDALRQRLTNAIENNTLPGAQPDASATPTS